jgi:hypothetical protein
METINGVYLSVEAHSLRRHHTLRSWLLTVVTFLPFLLLSQPSVRIAGTVFDQSSGTVLENVNIRVKGTYNGTTSDELGHFRITLEGLPATLIVSHIGYETQAVPFTLKPADEVSIYLVPRAQELPEVTVVTKKIDTVYADEHYSVLDYELTPGGIMLLIFRYRLSRSELLLTSRSGESLASLTLLPEKPTGLFGDCLGNVHLVTKERVYQIFPVGDTLKLLYPTDIDLFVNTMKNCLFELQGRMFFRMTGINDLEVNYYSIDTATRERKMFRVIRDEFKLNLLARNPEDYSALIRSYTNPMESDWSDFKVNPGYISDSYSVEFTDRFNRLAYYSPVYAPMAKLKDVMCIFNHPGGVVELYEPSGALLRTVPIAYHSPPKKTFYGSLLLAASGKEKWLNLVKTDPTAGKAYAIFLRPNGVQLLKEIDLQTGELTSPVELPYAFPEKINLDNGFVYFLYWTKGTNDRKKLFRMKVQ